MADVLRFDAVCKEIDVVLCDPSDKTEKDYKLKELIGRDRNKYLNKMKNRVKLDGKGQSLGIKTFDGFQADLLKISLFDPKTDDFVSEDFIEDLPSSTQMKLFNASQELSGLDNAKDSEEKND